MHDPWHFLQLFPTVLGGFLFFCLMRLITVSFDELARPLTKLPKKLFDDWRLGLLSSKGKALSLPVTTLHLFVCFFCYFWILLACGLYAKWSPNVWNAFLIIFLVMPFLVKPTAQVFRHMGVLLDSFSSVAIIVTSTMMTSLFYSFIAVLVLEALASRLKWLTLFFASLPHLVTHAV